ncbi:uncharacterized protein [Palaemon carinicauda]|uniref:uncharacterized protein isoform X2 n=1 Tax=Palaemon carinicauda TaxID=392227 RepID=UPI0035B6087D
MNNQGRPPSLFPWPTYLSGPHSSLTSAPRFPYDISGAQALHVYPHGSPAHGHARYHGRQASPSPMGIRTSPPSIIPVPGSRLEYSRSPDRYSRYSASSPRRRYPPDDDFTPENESVVVNAGFSFLMGKENSIIHKHVDIQPAHAISEAPSSGLTRQIDKFLKKSDHTLDRYQNLVQSRSGGRVGGLSQRGKSMTPAGGREESPEASTLGLSYRSQRSTSAASIAVKAEKHLESLLSEGKVRKTATAPIAEHEEDQLDDDLSISDSSLDGFDTDDDVPRSTDVFDISDDTSADLSKLSAIEVDPSTNCSTPFDPSRLDDLSSDSDDEYFDVVQLPGLKPPKSSSTHTPSASPLPDQQHSRPSEGNVTQEPSLIPPAHSRSMPAVNQGLTPIKMGNVLSYSPSVIPGTDTNDPVNTAQHLTQRKCTDTANLANAINVLAPPSSTRAKTENTFSGDIELEAQHTNKAENTMRKECTSLKEVTISGLNLIATESHQSSHSPCKDAKLESPCTSHCENSNKTVNSPKKEIDETHKTTNDDNIKKTYVSKPLSHNESDIKSNLVAADTLIKHTILKSENSPKSQISRQETLELPERNQTDAVFDITQKDEGKFKCMVSSKEENKVKEDSKVKLSDVNIQKAIVEDIPTLNSMQKGNMKDEHIKNEEEIASKKQIISGIVTTSNIPSSSNTKKESESERIHNEQKVEEARIEGTIVKKEDVLKAKSPPINQEIVSKKVEEATIEGTIVKKENVLKAKSPPINQEIVSKKVEEATIEGTIVKKENVLKAKSPPINQEIVSKKVEEARIEGTIVKKEDVLKAKSPPINQEIVSKKVEEATIEGTIVKKENVLKAKSPPINQEIVSKKVEEATIEGTIAKKENVLKAKSPPINQEIVSKKVEEATIEGTIAKKENVLKAKSPPINQEIVSKKVEEATIEGTIVKKENVLKAKSPPINQEIVSKKVEEARIEGTIVKKENVLKAKSPPIHHEIVSKKNLDVSDKIETLKTKKAEVEIMDKEGNMSTPNNGDNLRKVIPSGLKSNETEKETIDYVTSHEDEMDFSQKRVNIKDMNKLEEGVKPKNASHGMSPSSPPLTKQEPSVKPKYGKATYIEPKPSLVVNTNLNSNGKITESSDRVSKLKDFNQETALVDVKFVTSKESKPSCAVDALQNAVNGSVHVAAACNDKASVPKLSADTSVLNNAKSSISKEQLVVSLNESSLAQNSCSLELKDNKIASTKSPACSENVTAVGGTVPDLSDHKNVSTQLKGKSLDASLNTNIANIPPSTTTYETNGKPISKPVAESFLGAVAAEQNMCLGIPVSDNSTFTETNMTQIVTEKPHITPSPGPEPSKVSSCYVNEKAISRPEVVGNEATLSPISFTNVGLQPTKAEGSLEKNNKGGFDALVTAEVIEKNSQKEKSDVLSSKNKLEENFAKFVPMNEHLSIGNEVVDAKIVNGILKDSKLEMLPENKVQPTVQTVPHVNGIIINDSLEDKDDIDNNFSEVETLVDRSRCSSVASDTSYSMSQDVSQRTGIKKPKGEKLSAMMNIWENEDVSQASEKSKMKHPPNKPKVGKISGIKDMFESGKVAEKPEILKNPNLVKLRVASGASLVEPKSTLLPGASGIASVNAAKFGGTSKFKKPSECPPSAGDKNLRREKSNLSGNDLKKNDSSKKEANTIANLNQKDLGNVISKELENQGTVSNSCNNVVGSNNQKNLDCAANYDDHNHLVTVTSSENIEKTTTKDKCMVSKGDRDDKEKSVCSVKEENVQKEESFQISAKDKNLQCSKSAEAKAITTKKTLCSKDVSVITKQSGVGEKTNDEIPNTAETSSQSGEGMKKDLKKKKKRKKEKENEIHDEKEKNQDDKIIVKCESVNDAVDDKTSIVDCAANVSDRVKVELTKSECTKSESNFESKTTDTTKEDVKPGVGNNDKGKDVIIDQSTSAMTEQNNDVNNLESRFKGNKTLGGLKSFIIESVAKGGKTLEDKLSKTGIPLGKKSAKTDYLKDSLTLDLKNKKIITSSDVKVSENENPVLPKSPNKMSVEDFEKSKLDNKQTVTNLVPALESEVESLSKETSALVEPKKTSHLPNYSFPKLTLATKPLHSVASFPDTPMEGEICITSLPASPTEEKKNFEFCDKHKVLSLPASPTKEVHFNFEETSEEEEVFVDAIDPGQLDTLMPLPDVQNERDIRSRSRTPLDYREQSVTPSHIIAESEVILSETDRILRRSRSNKSLRRSYSRSLSNAALNRLSEVTADLSEEHTTAHLAGERLEAEQAERMKLEKEIDRLQTDVKRMTTANGKLEMEKLALRSEVLSAAELNGGGDDDDDEAADASLYKRKYEWCLREIELLKKQSKQQQEDDLDQLLLLKKQLEKKVADAYEETDEQRQVVAQLKRKCQRLQAEMNDLKILLEEQTSRNNLLEKKQRKFDQEVMSVQEELRHERSNKDKIQRERDQILSEKYSFEQEVTTLKLELELKEEKVAALNRELDDLNSSGKVEEEVATLKKAKHDLELRIKDQEEELDDLAGQVQMLEGAKVRLEMSMEQMRKENRREISQREEELEEIRLSAQKKVKSLEAQLENEHEERTLLVREKHELERRITDLQDRTITHVDEDYVHKLKKELKKTKALLRDTQTMLEKAQSEGSHKLILRQLKTQLEDAEFAKTAALKARQCAESDLADVSSQLDEALRAKKDSEEKCARVNKEKAEIQTQLEEGEEELAEVMKKYKAVVSQLSVDQITLSEQSQQIAELEHSKQVLQERMLELSSKVEVLEGETANIHTQRRLEMKIKEIESKLELELTTRQRLESQIGRLKDQIERLSGECDAAKMKESQAIDQSKKLARQLRDAKEDVSNIQQRHTEAVNKKSELEKQLELSDAEVITLKSDLKLAFKRIEDLQQAIQGDLSDSDSELSDSDSDSDGSLSSYLTASLKHQRSSSNSTLRTPPSEVQQLERLELPHSPCSEAMSAISEDLDDASNKESFA